MKRLHLIGFLILFSLGSQLFAQVTVKGKIIDKKSEPVIGATILEIGTSNGVITGIDGQFDILVSGPDAVLKISSIGFVP
jgi:hypothetical protein